MVTAEIHRKLNEAVVSKQLQLPILALDLDYFLLKTTSEPEMRRQLWESELVSSFHRDRTWTFVSVLLVCERRVVD